MLFKNTTQVTEHSVDGVLEPPSPAQPCPLALPVRREDLSHGLHTLHLLLLMAGDMTSQLQSYRPHHADA